MIKIKPLSNYKYLSLFGPKMKYPLQICSSTNKSTNEHILHLLINNFAFNYFIVNESTSYLIKVSLL